MTADKTHELLRTNPALGRATLMCGKEGKLVQGYTAVHSDSDPRQSIYRLALTGTDPTCLACRKVLEERCPRFSTVGNPHPKGWLALPPEKRRWPPTHRRRLFPEDYRSRV